jgi:hypothetical protein
MKLRYTGRAPAHDRFLCISLLRCTVYGMCTVCVIIYAARRAGQAVWPRAPRTLGTGQWAGIEASTALHRPPVTRSGRGTAPPARGAPTATDRGPCPVGGRHLVRRGDRPGVASAAPHAHSKPARHSCLTLAL